MSRIQDFKAYVKQQPMELDIAMSEVYRELTTGLSDFTMLDGGAHKGWHTWTMLNLAGVGSVWSVEADPTIGQVLSDRLGRWHKEAHPRLTIVRKALQDRSDVKEIAWMSSHSHAGRSSIRAANETSPSIWSEHKDVLYREETMVPATTIDQILEAEPRKLPFIKLDLEGADILALRGAEETLRTRRPLIAFENAGRAREVHGYTIEDIQRYFGSLGYVALNYVGQPMQPETWYELYEAWAAPIQQLDEVQALIDRAISRRI